MKPFTGYLILALGITTGIAANSFAKISEGLKLLQQNWREIGPVPNKYRNKVYDQFKGICDTFFDKKRLVYHKCPKYSCGKIGSLYFKSFKR